VQYLCCLSYLLRPPLINRSRSSYAEDQPFARWLNDAAVLPIFDGGNLGIRRRQIEKIYQQNSYDPWAAV
jgi:hypothetical protein